MTACPSILVVAVLLCTGCSKPAPERIYRVTYGVTRYLPPAFTELANDYVANDRKVVPEILKTCGVRFLVFDGYVTDGAEAAYFSVTGDDKREIACISAKLPHTDVRPANLELVKNRLSLASQQAGINAR